MQSPGSVCGHRQRLARAVHGPAVSPYRAPRATAAATRAHATSTAQLALYTGACCLPHPEKLATGGEDAYFISASRTAIGVADGVGGWRESGVDPGDYSRQFMRTACEYFDTHRGAAGAGDTAAWEEHARAALAIAHQKTRLPGSSTACVLTLNAAERWVSAANLGDSGFILVRNGTVVFSTPPLQHFFDCPLQFGACPDFVEATDYPSDAATYSLNVLEGDVVVMGSDGLWDNCELEDIVALLPDSNEDVDVAAERIASIARQHAEDPAYDSPYIKAARGEGIDMPWWQKVLATRVEDGQLKVGRLSGGKLDDITVVVARICERRPGGESSAEEESDSEAGSN